MGLPTVEARQAFILKYFELVRGKPQLVLGAKHVASKFALVFTKILRFDFPERCPQIF